MTKARLTAQEQVQEQLEAKVELLENRWDDLSSFVASHIRAAQDNFNKKTTREVMTVVLNKMTELEESDYCGICSHTIDNCQCVKLGLR